MKTVPYQYNWETGKTTGTTPIWIMECAFRQDGTIYLSDRCVTITGWKDLPVTTKPWIDSWGSIDENLSFDFAKSIISQFTLTVMVDQNQKPNIHEILWNDWNNIEASVCSLYLWFEGLNPESYEAPPLKLWSGNIVDFKRKSTLQYDLYFVDDSVRINKIIPERITVVEFPSAPKKSIGKVKPIIYGPAKKVPSLCITQGGVTTLNSPITGASTTINVVDGSVFPDSGGFTIQIGGEVISILSRNANNLTASRSNGWAHETGSLVVEEKTEFLYLVADHPVYNISNVYIDGLKIVSDDVTIYTGKSGNEHPQYPGKALISLSHSPVYIEQEFRPTDSSTVIVGSGMTVDPADYMVDGNGETASTVVDIYGNGDAVSYNALFSNINIFGRVTKQKTKNSWSAIPANANGITFRIDIGTTAVYIVNTGGDTVTGNRVEHETEAQTNPRVSVSQVGIGYGAFGAGGFEAIECWNKTVCYWRYNTSGGYADEIIIGQAIVCDVSGWPNSEESDMILSSQDIVRHIVEHYLDSSFFTDITSGESLVVVLNDETPIIDVLSRIAFQSFSWFRYYLGVGNLLMRTTSFSGDEDIGSIYVLQNTTTVERTPLSDIINHISVRYDRDWSLSGESAYNELCEIKDQISIALYGEKTHTGLQAFDYHYNSPASVCQKYLTYYAYRRSRVQFCTTLRYLYLEFADNVSLPLPIEPYIDVIVPNFNVEEADMITSGSVDFQVCKLGQNTYVGATNTQVRPAFADFGPENTDLINNIGNYLRVIDSNDNTIEGFILARGINETQIVHPDWVGMNDDLFGCRNGRFTYNTDLWEVDDGTMEITSGGQSGNCIALIGTTGQEPCLYGQNLQTNGGLMCLTFWVKSGTAGACDFEVFVPTHWLPGYPIPGDATEHYYIRGQSTSSWTQHTLYFPSTDSHTVMVRKLSSSSAGSILFDTIESKIVVAPSANGVTIWNRTTEDEQYRWQWVSFDPDFFNLFDTDGYTYEIYEVERKNFFIPPRTRLNGEIEKVNFDPKNSLITFSVREV